MHWNKLLGIFFIILNKLTIGLYEFSLLCEAIWTERVWFWPRSWNPTEWRVNTERVILTFLAIIWPLASASLIYSLLREAVWSKRVWLWGWRCHFNIRRWRVRDSSFIPPFHTSLHFVLSLYFHHLSLRDLCVMFTHAPSIFHSHYRTHQILKAKLCFPWYYRYICQVLSSLLNNSSPLPFMFSEARIYLPLMKHAKP